MNSAGEQQQAKLASTVSAIEVGLASDRRITVDVRSASVQPTFQAPLAGLVRNGFVEKLQLHKQMQQAMIEMEKSLGYNQFVHADLTENETNGLKAVPSRFLKSYSRRVKPPPPPPHQSDESPKLRKRDPLVSYNQRYVEEQTQSVLQQNLSKQVIVRLIKGQQRCHKESHNMMSSGLRNLEMQSMDSFDYRSSFVSGNEDEREVFKPKSRHSRAHSRMSPSNNIASRLNILLDKSIQPLKDSGISAMQRRRLRMNEFLADRREIQRWISRDSQLHSPNSPNPTKKIELSNLEKYSMDFNEYLKNQSSRKMKVRIQRQQRNRQQGSALDRYQQEALKDVNFSERVRHRLLKQFEIVRKQINRFE